MNEIDEGYFFWKRVDMVRPRNMTLKQLVEESQLSYHLVKVQRSCNRIPKALDAAKLATFLDVSLEWLLTGKIGTTEYKSDEILNQNERRQVSQIVHGLIASDRKIWRCIENALGIQQ